MKLSFGIREMIKAQSGCDLKLSSDCEKIVLDIYSKTGQHLGQNTLKRLLGFLNDEREPRVSTLDILARYLDFPDWETLNRIDDKSNSSFNSIEGELRVHELDIDSLIELAYFPNRVIKLLYKGDQKFLVTDSVNSKLIKGDFIEIHHIIQHFPLLAINVMRNGENLGSLTAGKVSGITSIKILK